MISKAIECETLAMEELLELYNNLPQTLCTIDDTEILNRADATLSSIEMLYPELLEEASKIIGFFSIDKSETFNIAVIGADGHSIVSVLRKHFFNANVKWITNTSSCSQYSEKVNGVILSALASSAYFSGNTPVCNPSDIVLPEGFILFSRFSSTETLSVLKALNKYEIIPFKILGTDYLYAIKPGLNSEQFNMFLKEQASFKGLCKYNKIYCVCPSLIKSGGPELLHQLVYTINSLGGNAEIAYANTIENSGYAHPELYKYVIGHISAVEVMEDRKDNAIIIPEGWPYMTERVHNAKILFWWLSVDNFFITCSNNNVAEVLDMVKKKSSLHLVQSEYARQFVNSVGVPKNNVLYLSDYINDVYLNNNIETCITREDIILYNPKKGKEYVETLIQLSPDLQWIPIIDMTTEQVRKLMKKSKVYVDFGNHPGKDRIPREAAASGCIVITGRQGSAAYREDVPIPEEFKFDEETVSYDIVINTIRKCMNNYEKIYRDFDDYRSMILSEKFKFQEDVKKIFFLEKSNDSGS